MLPGVNLLIRWYVGRCFVKDISLFGLRFKNPIGLAAGFDKNGHYIKEMSQLGFGFIEIGSVTALPALGNAQPRLFRIKNDQAIINRMGLNNLGVDALVKQLSGLNTGVPLFINVAKTPSAELEGDLAVADYCEAVKKIKDYADVIVIISVVQTAVMDEHSEAREPLTSLLKISVVLFLLEQYRYS